MRKLYAVALPVLAVVAFAVAPAAASAATTYGTCTTGTHSAPECPTGEKFTAFTEERVAVVDKKVSTNFVLENVAGTAGIECTVFKSAGFDWNAGGFGKSEEILVFEKCVGTGGLATACPAGVINGNGIIQGTATNEVTNATKVKINITGGFSVKCGASSFGSVTGEATGLQTAETAVLKFAAATGLTFNGAAATITGEAETETVETKKKVFI
jgi:hypothetical protein